MTESKLSWYSDWKCWEEKDFGKPSKDEFAYCDAEIGPYLSGTNPLILEVGFGNGGVLGWCRERGYDCVGVETNPLLVARAAKSRFTAFETLYRG